MRITPIIAFVSPDTFPGALFTALILTAAMIIPAGFLFAVLREKMAATISGKGNRSSLPTQAPSSAVDPRLLLCAAAIISLTSARRAKPVNPGMTLHPESHTPAATSVFSHN